VTEWAVAPIPADASPSAADVPMASGSAAAAASVGQFAVDDEPEEASVRIATLAREGEVLPPRDVEPSIAPSDDDAPDEDEPEPEPLDAPVPPVIAPRIVTAPGGVQRYGEAVVRQVLGATFVREEPYQAPTRFG
jgi:DNA polymerase-3 subunit gamma/tau